ncbi:MAG: hypothetical protein EOM26_00405 [Alphaproteobacteria bacterium]|nr:hypothetical protein [Alphaproteobacteria bacterium]
MDEFEGLENRYGSAFVQDIRDRLALCETKEIQYFELKQMNDFILPRYRMTARRLVRQVRLWKAQYEREEDQLERVYKAYEGIFLRRQLSDALNLYVMANRDYHEMRRTYLHRLMGLTSFSGKSAKAA